MNPTMTGAGIGLLAGLGGWLVLVRLPRWRRPTLEDRLAPYLRDAPPRPRAASSERSGHANRERRAWARSPGRGDRGAGHPLHALELLLAPVMADAVRLVERLVGGGATVRRRLDRLDGSGGDRLERFRAEQVVWGAVGAAAGAAVGSAAGAVGRGFSVVPALVLVAVGGLLGVLGRDRWLTVQVDRREQRMLDELPTVAELLALSVGAGEGAVGALERVGRTCDGELAAELRRTLADARAGGGLVAALDTLARRTGVAGIARFVDGVAVAVERGTPLADVLRAQAQDVRELARRRLIESGGRKEIFMMVPVVFLVLPVTVLFAVYPGLAVLDLSR